MFKIKQLQIKIVTRLKLLGNRNIFGVSKVSKPPESNISIMKIEFTMFVVEAPASKMHLESNISVGGIFNSCWVPTGD